MYSSTFALLALSVASVQATVVFSPLGDLSGGTFSSAAYGVSADGAVVTGMGSSANGTEAFRWTASGGMSGLGDLPGGTFESVVGGISGDGLTIVGSSIAVNGREAFKWTLGTGMVGLGDLSGGNFQSTAYAASGNGSRIVGFGTTTVSAQNGFVGQEAVHWSSGGSAVSISGEYANAVSADGTVIAGRRNGVSGSEAFRWTLETGVTGLGDFPGGGFYSEAHGVSADGLTIVGQGFTAAGSEAFIWQEGTGLVGLGDLAGGTFYSYAWGVSGNGNVIVGTGKSAVGDEAFIWDPANGMRNLREVLVSEYGVSGLSGWTLTAARAISADGTTIVGEGINPQGQVEAWHVTGIPEPSSALLFIAGAMVCARRRR